MDHFTLTKLPLLCIQNITRCLEAREVYELSNTSIRMSNIVRITISNRILVVKRIGPRMLSILILKKLSEYTFVQTTEYFSTNERMYNVLWKMILNIKPKITLFESSIEEAREIFQASSENLRIFRIESNICTVVISGCPSADVFEEIMDHLKDGIMYLSVNDGRFLVAKKHALSLLKFKKVEFHILQLSDTCINSIVYTWQNCQSNLIRLVVKDTGRILKIESILENLEMIESDDDISFDQHMMFIIPRTMGSMGSFSRTGNYGFTLSAPETDTETF